MWLLASAVAFQTARIIAQRLPAPTVFRAPQPPPEAEIYARKTGMPPGVALYVLRVTNGPRQQLLSPVELANSVERRVSSHALVTTTWRQN